MFKYGATNTTKPVVHYFLSPLLKQNVIHQRKDNDKEQL